MKESSYILIQACAIVLVALIHAIMPIPLPYVVLICTYFIIVSLMSIAENIEKLIDKE